ncbi:MAG: hypothetical protein LE169_02500 [Endomicrobium sp.]|nr:hypothetical protein [Endomicrobium sp.]
MVALLKNCNNHKNKISHLKKTFSANENIMSIRYVYDECAILLGDFLAERNVARNKFCDSIQKGIKDNEPPQTNLDNVMEIWNSLITHRVLEVYGGITFTLKMNSGVNYPTYQMSDVEKEKIAFLFT